MDEKVTWYYPFILALGFAGILGGMNPVRGIVQFAVDVVVTYALFYGLFYVLLVVESKIKHVLKREN